MRFGSARRLRLILVFLLSAAFVAAVAASPGAAQERSTIRAGDIVAITVYGDPELTVEAPVLPDGTIYYPFAGSVEVAGKSPAEIAEELSEVLAEFVRNPVVAVAVRQGRGPSVAVLGEVLNPGLYPLPSGSASLLEVIATAGGPLSTANLAGVRIYEGGSIRDYRDAPIGADGVLFEGEASQNPEVLPGNVVYVPRGLIEVSAVGLVERPGSYEVRAGARVLDLISLAGGLLPEADPSSLILRRQAPSGAVERFTLDLQGLLVGSAPNYLLEDGDLLYVQPTIQVAVAGEVRNNGVFRLGSNSRLTDAILAAGGTTLDADLKRLTVSRSNGSAQELVEVDFERVLSGKAENIPLRDGDIVNVPRGVNVVYVAGEVVNPGAYRVLPNARLIDAVYAAGGPTKDGEIEAVQVFAAPDGAGRPGDGPWSQGEGGEPGRALFTGPLEKNPPIEPGQTIFVPKKNVEIFVLGAVKAPGLVEVPRGSTLLDVVALVGGPDIRGDWTSVQLLRKGAATPERFDVWALLEAPDEAAGVVLSEGDALYVPENVTRVSVIGDVVRPGTYSLTRSSRLVDALAAAGGVADTAALESVSVMQSTERLDPLRVRLGEHDELRPEEIASNLALEDGTVVVVPKSRRITWEKVITVLTGVKLILDLVDRFN